MSTQVIIFLFFSFVGILLSVLFFFKKTNNKRANRLLSLYTFLASSQMIYECLNWSGLLQTKAFVHLNLVPYLFWVSFGPILYFYVRSLFDRKYYKSDLAFLIPPVIIFLLLSPFYILNTANKLKVVLNNEIGNYTYMPSYGIWIILGLMFFYGFLIYNRFKDHRKIGYKEKIWLQWLIASYLIFVLLFIIFFVLVRFDLMDRKYDYFIDGAITFFIGMVAYFGFVQPEVFKGQKPLSKLIPLYRKYSKSGLSEALSIDLKNRLIKIMKDEKPYLKSDLRMNELANLLKVSRNHTSQIINEHFNLSFFDFINRYRVEEAKILLSDPDEDLNITAVAYQVGFNNRASFYKAFKKFTNQNPTTFLKHLQVS